MTSWCCVGTFKSLIWFYDDANYFLQISYYPSSDICPDIPPRHNLSLSRCWFALLPYSSFILNLFRNLRISNRLVWTAQCPVSKAFTSGAASSVYWRAPENTAFIYLFLLIWQKIGQPLNILKSWPKGPVHSFWLSLKAERDYGEDEGGTWATTDVEERQKERERKARQVFRVWDGRG